MREISLRQLAKDIGVSQSYLSQIKSGNRPPSKKVISKLRAIDKQKHPVSGCSKSNVNDIITRTLGISLAVGQRTLDP